MSDNSPTPRSPILPSEPPSILDKLESHYRGRVRPVRLLIVDDDVSVIEAMKYVVQHVGAEGCFVTDGEQALDMLKVEPGYDMILLDLKMMPMDGVACAEKMMEVVPATPIVFCTCYPDWPTLANRQRSRCLEVLIKPVGIKELSDLLRRYRLQQ